MITSMEINLEKNSSQPTAEPSMQQPGTTDFAPGIEAAFPARFQEFDCRVEISGDPLPDFLRGTYYLNGPARFGFDDLRYKHWLDGDGMVCAIRFRKAAAKLRSRYIQSRKFKEEQKAGKPLYRTFGTAFPGSRLNALNNGLESPVNVSVYPIHDRLLAFGEQGLPWELNPVTLETRGQFTCNGQLNDASPFSAHPKFDSTTGEMLNFGILFSMQAPRLYFYCFGPEGLRFRRAVPLEYPCSVHDFSISKNFAVFYLSPYLLNTAKLLQNGTVLDSLRWKPECGSRMLVLARNTGETIASIPVGHRYCLHLINSFEQDGQLTVDVLEFSEPLYSQYQPVPDLFHSVPSGHPARFVINLKSRELVQHISLGGASSPDFATINTEHCMRPYSDFWMLGISAASNRGRKFFDRLIHSRWNEQSFSDIYECPRLRYLSGEPVFVGVTGSEEGVILCQELDVQNARTCFLVFNAGKVSSGPVTRLALDGILYPGFHAGFKPTPLLQ